MERSEGTLVKILEILMEISGRIHRVDEYDL